MQSSTQTENRQHTCQECETEFEVNRLKQKFCTRKCRNRFNNRIVRQDKQFTTRIDNILHQNRKILAANIGKQILISDLKSQGFNFKYFTDINKQDGMDFFNCYNYYYSYNGDFVHINKFK